MSVELVMPSKQLVLCHPLPLLPSIFPSIRSFLISQIFISGGQSIRASASASVLPVNIQGWFPLGRTGLISLLSKGLSRVFSSTTIWKHQFFGELSHQYITIGKTITLTIQTFVGKVMSLLYNMLSRFVIAFLPRRKCLLISCCSHCLQRFWSSRKYSLSLLPFLPFLFAMKWCDWMPRS